MQVDLYTGPNCSLCEKAKDLLAELPETMDITVTSVNIRNDVSLYHQYAVRIPVLKRQDNHNELGWPFDLAQLEQFLS